MAVGHTPGYSESDSKSVYTARGDPLLAHTCVLNGCVLEAMAHHYQAREAHAEPSFVKEKPKAPAALFFLPCLCSHLERCASYSHITRPCLRTAPHTHVCTPSSLPVANPHWQSTCALPPHMRKLLPLLLHLSHANRQPTFLSLPMRAHVPARALAFHLHDS